MYSMNHKQLQFDTFFSSHVRHVFFTPLEEPWVEAGLKSGSLFTQKLLRHSELARFDSYTLYPK